MASGLFKKVSKKDSSDSNRHSVIQKDSIVLIQYQKEYDINGVTGNPDVLDSCVLNINLVAGSSKLLKQAISTGSSCRGSCDSIQTKPKLIEPLDYENVLVKNKTLLHNDPQRELLIFPPDDVTTSHIPRKFRTVSSSVSETSKKEAKSLLVKECIKSYTGSWSRVHYKYSPYSGGFQQLPKVEHANELPQQVFEVDEEHNQKPEEDPFLQLKMKTQQITKQGWLYKGPDNGNESNFSAFTRSFKRRYFYLKQQADTTYLMEFHKDDKKIDPKGSIFLDSATSVVKNNHRGKPSMELHMQDKSYYMFAADSDSDLDPWITALNKVIQSNEAANEKLKELQGTPVKSENFQQSLEHSMNPELQKYARETDSLLSQQRKEGRQKLFAIYPDVQKLSKSRVEDQWGQNREMEMYKEVFGTRFVIEFDSFQLRLQATVEENGGDIPANPEPFFITFALYDAKNACKISEDFHFDPNTKAIRAMIPDHVKQANGHVGVNGSMNGESHTINGLNPQWLAYPNKAVFSVTSPHPDIYLVARIEKVLNGAITSSAEPYMRTPDLKAGSKIHKQMKLYCTRLGHYKMPFAWAARPLFKYSKSTAQSNQSNGSISDLERPVFKPFTVELDTYSDFAIYKAEGSKNSEEDLIKNIQDFKNHKSKKVHSVSRQGSSAKHRPEKQGKWQPIYGTLKIRLNSYDKTYIKDLVTSSLLAVQQFSMPPERVPAKEVEEFVPPEGKFGHPYAVYKNHLYIYPKNLKYDAQKIFAKARNIACSLEVREADDGESSPPLRCIYGNQGPDVLTTVARCAVIHHNSSPDFLEEIKILLPTQLHSRHHIVFTFHHVSCELKADRTSKTSTKKSPQPDTVVGWAWFPILDEKGRINVGMGDDKKYGELHLKVSTNLPQGYLNHESFGLNKGASGPDVRWVDSGKPLFRFNVRLVSTVYTKDQHLHNFFSHCQGNQGSTTATASHDFETANKLKTSLHGKMAGGVTLTPPGSKGTPYDQQMLILVKSLHATDSATLINFLPTILNQLFRLLVQTTNDDVSNNAARVLIHIVNCVHAENKPEILKTYVKYVFVTEPAAGTKHRTVHEQLANNLTSILRPTQTDQLVIGKFMNHSWFFFEILIKSMAQHLLSTGRIKMSRHERFSSDYQFNVRTLTETLATHITHKYRELPSESKNANISLANFIKRCFTFMDRGFAFKLVNTCIETFCTNDAPQLQTYKFEFMRVICEHEHYIQLNLPLMRTKVNNYKDAIKYLMSKNCAPEDLKHDYTLSEEFRKNHFLVGLLLQEVKQALNQVRDVRKVAISTLRNLLAKHSFDDRYTGKSQQSRVASLYLPFLTVILENKNRLTPKETLPSPTGGNQQGAGDQSENTSISRPTISSHDSFADSSSAHSSTSNVQSRSSASLPRQKDPSVFALIAGQVSNLNSLSDLSKRDSQHGSSSSLTSKGSGGSTDTMTGRGDGDSTRGSERSGSSHQRSASITGQSNCTTPYGVMRYDKLDQQEIKDLLACFLFIVNNLAEEVLLGWFNNSAEFDIMDFFEVLDICLQQFKYVGRKRITSLYIIGDSGIGGVPKSLTLPVKKGPAPLTPSGRSSSLMGSELGQMIAGQSKTGELDAQMRAQMEANLSSEVAMVVLDVVSLYTQHFKDQLQQRDGDNNVMHRVFDLHLHFLQSTQSQHVQKNAFASLRAFINKFPRVLFQGDATTCGRMCYEILRCCNSKLNSSRSEACTLMYLLMRSNFEFCKRKSFNRVHLQMIVAVSQLINDVVGISSSRFIDSLSVINSYANNDKAMQRTVFPVEVKDLTKRIRTVLMATAQMREHHNNPEMLIDLQYSLAKSYTSTPELRKTWLDSMAKNHVKYENFSEAAHCYLHIAALVAEYLKRRGEFPQGCAAFKNISSNVQSEEAGMRDDMGMQDVHYTEDHLTDLLEECARSFEKAERYELLGEIYRLIIPIYERKRDFTKLASAYELLHTAYTKVVEVMHTGKRMLGKFYRVKFYGQAYFEEEDGKEYVYKEPKVTGLHDICDRLKSMYSDKFGKNKVKLIQDSNKVKPEDLDPNIAYIQISHVTPYFEQSDLETRLTDFERNTNLKRFMYETPFTRDGKAHGEVGDQWKRRTILTSSHSFPYVKKRILVNYHQEKELSPIDCATDEMRSKVIELNEVVYQTKPDVKKLQLKLSGSISPQVNAGPMAYAEAFLRKDDKYGAEKVSQLKEHFREFVHICHAAIDLNGRLIQSDQLDYQDVLRQNFREMVSRLSIIFDEQLLPDLDFTINGGHRGSLSVFSTMSNTSSNSSSSTV